MLEQLIEAVKSGELVAIQFMRSGGPNGWMSPDELNKNLLLGPGKGKKKVKTAKGAQTFDATETTGGDFPGLPIPQRNGKKIADSRNWWVSFIKAVRKNNYPISGACKAVGVSYSNYYGKASELTKAKLL